MKIFEAFILNMLNIKFSSPYVSLDLSLIRLVAYG
jgi:hypothetical protein